MDQATLHDIYPIWHIPFWQTKWFFWGIVSLCILVCCLAVVGIYAWYQKRNKRVMTPWDTALQTINRLQNNNYTSQQESKQCYFTLTTALKQYLADRFAYPIAHQTDEEAARYLEKQSLDPQLKKNIQEILRGCLLIKFANQQAMNEQIQAHLALAKEIIVKTIPQTSDQKAPTQSS